MTDASYGSVHAISDGGLAGKHAAVQSPGVQAAPTFAQDANTLRAPFVPIGCWRLEDLRFEFGSSFIRPEAALEFAQLAELVKEQPESPLSIFGHADPIGLDENNKKLSGRRAAAVYAMLTRKTEIFEDIYSQTGKYTAPHEVDQWGSKAVRQMLGDLGYVPEQVNGKKGDQTQEAVKAFQKDQGLAADGNPGKLTRAKLFLAYMDKNCRDGKGDSFKLEPGDFLARGKDSLGKGDYQGCGEFNPLMLFSQDEQLKYQKAELKTERDEENGVNRRVLVLLFRPGSQVKPDKWPCPRAKEGSAGCRKRFWSDGEDRRNKRLPTSRRKHDESQDTFACRFYDRLANTSPCERLIKHHTFYYGLQMGANMPWSEAASLCFKSENESHVRTFPVSLAAEVGCYRVVAFPDWRPGVRYKGEVKEGYRIIQLFDYCELSAASQASEGLNLLAPVPGSERPPGSGRRVSGRLSLPTVAVQDEPAPGEEELEGSRHAAEPHRGGKSAY